MSKKQKSNKKGSIKEYFKKNGKKMAIGTGIDIGGAVAGGGLGALVGGKKAFWGGLGTIILGHLIGDKGRIVQSLGVGAAAYGLASVNPFDSNTQQPVNGTLGAADQGIKERLTTFKDNLLHATFLDKLIGEKSKNEDPNSEDASIGSIDVSELDVFENYANEQAYLQALSEEQDNSDAMMLDQESGLDDEQAPEGSEEFDNEYTPFEEISPMEVDMRTI
ncbi:MAG: hypothetical protein Crog4KO_25940 [Crocinitomicaceae bacterium]